VYRFFAKPEPLAAVAPVAGHLWVPATALASPVALFYLVGGDDPLNPPDGGWVSSPWVGPEWKPAPRDSVERWAAMLGCPPTPAVVPDADGVRVVRYAPCRGDTEVLWYTIAGLGHTWPDRSVPVPAAPSGGASDRVSATEAIWRFFERHPKS
jgi:polyhydroxybutyrate depolymerase